MQEVEPDRRLHRLLILSDGVFALSLTLLAVQLALPEGPQDLRGERSSSRSVGILA